MVDRFGQVSGDFSLERHGARGAFGTVAPSSRFFGGVNTSGAFDPLSLNPILAFEAEKSMMAPLASESLDLDPANPSSLDIITATRAGTATFTDASGNIQTASPNTVRVDHVGGVPMILVEPAATNLIVNSEDFSGVDWSYSSNAIEVSESNSTLSPTGLQTADKLSKTTTRVYAYAHTNQTITSGQAYTWSVFMKKGTHDIGYLSLNQGDTEYKAFYDLTGGTSGMITGSATSSIEDFGNDWFRCSLRGVSSTSDVSVRFNFGMSYTTSGENWPSGSQGAGLYVYIWGAQLEQGTVATSFIPTSGSAVTRAADDLVIDGSDFTNFYNQSEGTIYIEWQREATNTVYPFTISDGGSGNYIRINNASTCRIKTGSSEQASLSLGSSNTGQINRAAVSFAANNFDGSKNGGAVVSDSAGTPPTVNQLQIGGLYSTGSEINGHIKRLIYWPHHSDNL